MPDWKVSTAYVTHYIRCCGQAADTQVKLVKPALLLQVV